MLGKWKTRKKYGLTLANLIPATIALRKEVGRKAFRRMDPEEIAERLLAMRTEADPRAFAEPGIDWDKLIEIIMQLLPLILKIIALF